MKNEVVYTTAIHPSVQMKNEIEAAPSPPQFHFVRGCPRLPCKPMPAFTAEILTNQRRGCAWIAGSIGDCPMIDNEFSRKRVSDEMFKYTRSD